MQTAINPNLAFDFSEAGVVVVERSESYSEILVQMLMGFGFRRVRRSVDLESAAMTGSSSDPALVVADLGQHDEPIVALIQRVREIDASAKRSTALIGTAINPSIDFVTSVKACGADFVLIKPFSAATLLKRILWVATGSAASPRR